MSSYAASSMRPVSPTSASLAGKTAHAAEIELRDIVAILRRRGGIILLALALGIILALIFVAFARKEYSSTATIEINKESSNELGMLDLSGITSGLGGENEMNMDLLTEQSVIRSDNTALSVIEQLKLDSTPPYAIPATKDSAESGLSRERRLPLEKAPLQRDRLLAMFRSRLNVSLIKGTRLVDVTYTDTDASRSTAIANAVVDAYMNEYTQARYQASSRASSWLAGQLADLKDKVATTQAKVDEFQRESGLTGITIPVETRRAGESGSSGSVESSSDNVPLERLIELNRDLTNAEVSRISKEAIYRMAETQDPDVVLGIGSSSLASGLGPGSPLSPGSSDLTLLQQLRQAQAQVRVQLAGSDATYGAKNPAMIQLHNEDAAFTAQIQAELERIRTRAKNDLDLAVLNEKGIQGQVAAQEQDVNKVTAKADQLVLLQEEALSSREIYQDLYSKLEEASVTAGMKASNITLVNPARIPSRPSSPKEKLALAIGGVLGLILGLITAFLWDYFDDSVVSLEQVEQITAVPIIGAIPDFAQKQSMYGRYGLSPKSQESMEKKSTSWVLRAPRSHVTEAYRTLRTALLMSRAEKAPKVMLIMSGSPGEGKTTTCLNTAAAFAIQGDKVLYIDADMRRAQGHNFFGTPNEAGLSNCLTGGQPFEQLLVQYPGIESLFLLAAGPHPPNPSELIGSKRFGELLAELKKHFDYIFIDSPPVLLVTDAQLISSLVDGYVLVIRSSRTAKRALQRSLSLMRNSGAAALGIVMNALHAGSASYPGYGYYGKGNGYYVEEPR